MPFEQGIAELLRFKFCPAIYNILQKFCIVIGRKGLMFF